MFQSIMPVRRAVRRSTRFRRPLARHARQLAAGVVAAVVTLGAWSSIASRADAATTAPQTIWGTSTPSGLTLVRDTAAVELGTKFTAKEAGTVSGVRFYKAPGMTGAHAGSLWSSSGQRLATVAFAGESASGWQTARLATPIRLSAGSTYVVSYHVPAGGLYAASRKFYGHSTTSSLAVPTSNAGVYSYSKSASFPTSAWQSSQYWVDVAFAPALQPSASSTPTPTPSASSTPSVSATPTPSVSATPTLSASATPTPSAASSGSVVSSFPKRSTTGVPAGWTPKQVVTGDYTITQDGQVVEDLRVTGGTLSVRAQNVTLRRVEIVSGQISNVYASRCYNGLRIEDTTILRGAEDIGQPAVQFGGYTAVRVKIDGPSEGFRVGGADYGCGPVSIQESFINVEPYAECASGTLPDNTWHGDAIQGYMGPALTLRNSYIRLGAVANCWGTAGFFYPSGQGNTRATVENVLIEGGAYSFRLETPGAVSGLKIVNDAWHYGAIYNRSACPTITWGAGNEIVTVKSDGTLASVRSAGCAG